MPRYEPDLTKVTATIEIFPKGDYEFSIGEPKSFARNKRDPETGLELADQEVVGVRYPLTCEEVHEGDSNFKGKRTILSLYVHTEGAQGFAKQFLLAADGRRPQGASNNEMSAAEKEFDEAHAGQDWSIDPESGACGDVWRESTGKRVIVSTDVMANNRTGDQMQQFTGYRSVG